MVLSLGIWSWLVDALGKMGNRGSSRCGARRSAGCREARAPREVGSRHRALGLLLAIVRSGLYQNEAVNPAGSMLVPQNMLLCAGLLSASAGSC